MADLYAFSSLRAPRRSEAADDSTLITEWSEIDSAVMTHVQRWDWRGNEFIPLLRELVANAEDPSAQAPGLAEAFLDGPTAITLRTLRGGVDPMAGMPGDVAGETVSIPGQVGLAVIDRLDRWLVARDNQPQPDELEEWLGNSRSTLASELGFEAARDDAEPQPFPFGSRAAVYGLLGAAWSRLLDSLAAALLLPREGELAQRLNRLLLVAGVLERRSFYRRALSAREVLDLLAHRTPLLPDPPFPDVLPEAQVNLVRHATTSDLFVVRKEWRGYVADEIAEIRNVMAHEHDDRRFVRIDESELVDTTTSSTSSTTESSSETSDESKFNEQSKRELDLAISAKGQVDVSAQYTAVKLDVSAGFSTDFSLKDSTERATEIAKKAVARASSKVETQTRQDRTRRTLSRTELRERHRLNNITAEHVRGVYRWVTRVDRFQIWRYPDRLQLEFEIPEPGHFLLQELSNLPTRAGGVGKPPDFALPGGITAENYLTLAATYGAVGLPAPPQPVTGTSAAIALAAKDPGTAPAGDYWNAPVLAQSLEVAVPSGYAVTAVTVNIEATPFHASWQREMSGHVGYDKLETLHTITATVAAGDQMVFDNQPGPGGGTNSVMNSNAPQNHLVQYLDGHLHHGGLEQALLQPVTVKLPLSVCLVGAWSGNVGITLKCELTKQAKDAWVQGVYDALRAAYDTWLAEWRAEQRMSGTPATLNERSPARHAAMIQVEIRRHVISWLLGESPFQGRDALPTAVQPPATSNAPDIDPGAALSSASTIQFLEQSLEWSNLAWVSYPYYWAGRERWSGLMDLETVDPALGEFLRAGSIRAVVPVRPGFSAAVLHWLTFRQPWLGGSCAPVPGQPMYVSVAREIRDQLMPPPDGEPGESWEVMLPTTLQWLDGNVSSLPHNALARLGQAPHEPHEILLADDAE